MTTNWNEIRKLAADLQKAQCGQSLQRLSERNCVEIVMKLTKEKLLDVIFTTNGKEYLTPQHLRKEIEDELIVSGGRISLGDLSTILKVDYGVIESQSSFLSQNNQDIHLVLGQLLNNDYLDGIAEKINETLMVKGILSTGSLTQDFDLPPDFLTEAVKLRMGRIIQGYQDEKDEKTLLTKSHVARQRAKIRGVLSAITKPTSVSSILVRFGFDERLFISLANELISTGIIHGGWQGGKRPSIYIPNIYASKQNEWIDNFYQNNGYLEYDAISRLGVHDPKNYIKIRFESHSHKVPLTYLPTIVLNSELKDSLEVSLDEIRGSLGWSELSSLIPPILTSEDITVLLTEFVDPSLEKQILLLNSNFLVSVPFLEKVKIHLLEGLEDKIQLDLNDGTAKTFFGNEYESLFLSSSSSCSSFSSDFVEGDFSSRDKKDERRRKACGGKAGGGAQGRETKTKSSVKNKKIMERNEERIKSKKGSEFKDVKNPLEFKSVSSLKNNINYFLPEIPTELISVIAEYMYSILNSEYEERLRDSYLKFLSSSSRIPDKKTTIEKSEKINFLFTTIRLSFRGLSLLRDPERKMEKSLLSTLCTDLCDEVLSFIASSYSLTMSQNDSKARIELTHKIPKNNGEPLRLILSALSGSSLTHFITTFEELLFPASGFTIHSKGGGGDKKIDRQILFQFRQNLLEQLSSVELEDETTALHLVCLASFAIISGEMLSLPSKFIPNLLEYLKDVIDEEKYSLLMEYQNLLLSYLVCLNDEEQQSRKKTLKNELESRTKALQGIPASLKKQHWNDK